MNKLVNRMFNALKLSDYHDMEMYQKEFEKLYNRFAFYNIEVIIDFQSLEPQYGYSVYGSYDIKSYIENGTLVDPFFIVSYNIVKHDREIFDLIFTIIAKNNNIEDTLEECDNKMLQKSNTIIKERDLKKLHNDILTLTTKLNSMDVNRHHDKVKELADTIISLKKAYDSIKSL